MTFLLKLSLCVLKYYKYGEGLLSRGEILHSRLKAISIKHNAFDNMSKYIAT